jgi:hypothetical protein
MSGGRSSVFPSVVLSLAVFAVGAGLASGVVVYLQRRLHDEIGKRGHYVAGSLATNVTYGVLTKDLALCQHLAEGTQIDGDVALIAIRTPEGAILAAAGPSVGPGDLQALPAPAARRERRTLRHPRLGEVALFRAPIWDLQEGSARRPLGEVDVAILVPRLERHRRLTLGAALFGMLLWSVALGMSVSQLRAGSANRAGRGQ